MAPARVRRSLLIVLAVGLCCLLAGCGGQTVVTVPASSATATSFTPAGYQTVRAYLRLDRRIRNKRLSLPARIARLAPLCRHLGPNVADLEVDALRSACAGGFKELRAALAIRACNNLVLSARRPCVVRGFQLYDSGSSQVVGGENGILQILARGPCYSFMDEGVADDRRVLAASDQLVAALTSDFVTRHLLNVWQHAVNVSARSGPSLAVLVKQSKACQPV